jgi:hypothetical protein
VLLTDSSPTIAVSQQITQESEQPTLDNSLDVGLQIEVSDEGFLMHQGQYLNLSDVPASVELETTEEVPVAPQSVSVYDISPIPQPQPAATKRKSKCKRSEILTATPMKTYLEVKTDKQINKQMTQNKSKSAKRKLQLSTAERTTRPTKKPKKQTRNKASSEVWRCTQCNKVYGDPDDPKLSEDWLSCRCGNKYHFSCGEANGMLHGDDVLTCKNCVKAYIGNAEY